MRFGAMVLLAGLAAQPTRAGQKQFARITVCVDRQPGVAVAEPVAWGMFHSAGVTIDWRGIKNCPIDGVVVTLRTETPAALRPGSLAHALPYEGTHVEVFYDRVVRAAGDGDASILLAHVMVHEITHILQGIARHSASGVMKATFTAEDFRRMQVKPLGFTADDIDLIRLGMEKLRPGRCRTGGHTRN